MNVQQIAEICHDLNRAYCKALGDESQAPWSEAPEWQRQSALNGVLAIESGQVQYPWDSHDYWMAEKLADGWVYGEVKDPEKKTHPCLVEFNDLPLDQRKKDFLFYHVAMVLLAQPEE